MCETVISFFYNRDIMKILSRSSKIKVLTLKSIIEKSRFSIYENKSIKNNNYSFFFFGGFRTLILFLGSISTSLKTYFGSVNLGSNRSGAR